MKFRKSIRNGIAVFEYQSGGVRPITTEEGEMYDLLAQAVEIIEELGKVVAQASPKLTKQDKEHAGKVYTRAFDFVEKEVRGNMPDRR